MVLEDHALDHDHDAGIWLACGECILAASEHGGEYHIMR
jgi:hypothetical protein